MSAHRPHGPITPQKLAWSRRAGLPVCLALIALSGGGSHGQTSTDTPGLNYFKNYFVTGNFVTASVDFGSQSGGGGFVTGTITVDQQEEQLPSSDADVVGAFLYWQTIVTDGQALPSGPNGGLQFGTSVETFDITRLANEVGSRPLNATFSPCWTGGGGNATFTMKTFRADVRRLLPYATDSLGLPVGKALVNNQTFTVRLPDNGTGNQTPQTAGATLVIIYRLSTETLKSVVLYDGLQLKADGAPSTTTTTQTIRGFYDAAASPVARLGLLVGSGAKNGTEQVFLDGNANPVATDPFFARDSNSPGSDRAWDGKTWPVGSLIPQALSDGTLQIGSDVRSYGQQIRVQLRHSSASPYDCLATSAMVFSTEVNDADFDGLLDVWETGDLSGEPLHEPDSLPTAPKPLPNLKAMGALKDEQDVFIQVDFMKPDSGYSTPLGDVPMHTHLPSQAVFNDIATMFQQAGVRQNPAQTSETKSGAIRMHFDVGANYAGSNFVPASLARGGVAIPETKFCDVGGDCSFPGFYGVVGWKRGFQVLKEDHFEENRRHIFRWALFAHALGIPREDDPTTAFIDESKFPKSISGASDAGDGGGDFVITLGLWDNAAGTDFVQKSTFVHEFGHTAGLRHGGDQSTASFAAVNCKPTYQSVMNYLFQVRGLIGPTGPRIDYSRQDLQLRGLTGNTKADLNEANLTETELRTQVGNDGALYPTRWYAPKTSSFLDNNPQINTSASTRHCDGSPLEPGTNPADAIEMVRVDGAYPVDRIDWNANGTFESASLPAQDINFNGDGDHTTLDPAADGHFTGWNDWQHLDLRQVGARRAPGILSLEIARDDLPETDPIHGDWGYGDGNHGDWGYGDWGYGDWGYGDWGYGDWGYGDWGYGDWGYGDDIDETQARSQGPAPNSLSFTTTNQAIILRWQPPTAGGTVKFYEVWRAEGVISASNLPINLTPGGLTPGGSTPACTPAGCSYTDGSSRNNRPYQYFVVVQFNSDQRARSEILAARR